MTGGEWTTLELMTLAKMNQKTVFISANPPWYDADLKLYLQMNEGTGTDTYDESGNSHNATLDGATWVDGKYGKALNFDGSNDWVNIPTSTDFDFYPTTEDGISFSFWIKTTDANTRDIISRDIGGGSFWLIRIVGGQIYVQFWDGTYGSWSFSSITINDGAWHHIVISLAFSNNTTYVYVDGADYTLPFGAQDIGDHFNGTNPIKIAYGTFSGGYFAGVLDDFRFFSRPLSAAEVTTLYIGGKQSYAGQLWVDTTAGAVKVRNAANNAWAISIVNIIDLTCSGILKTTGNYLGVGDAVDLLYKKAGYYAFINQPLVLQGGLSIGGASGGGAPAWGGTEVISSARALANVTANASIINAGIFDIARIPTMDAAHLPLITTVASANLKFSDDTEKYTVATSYTKIKEIKINSPMSTIRIKFSLLNDLGGGYLTYGRIYLNGVAIGAIRSTNSTTYVEYSEDIAINVKAGDLLQIYCMTGNSSSPAYTCNFRLYWDISETVCVAQDP